MITPLMFYTWRVRRQTYELPSHPIQSALPLLNGPCLFPTPVRTEACWLVMYQYVTPANDHLSRY